MGVVVGWGLTWKISPSASAASNVRIHDGNLVVAEDLSVGIEGIPASRRQLEPSPPFLWKKNQSLMQVWEA